MANRWMEQFFYSLTHRPVLLRGKFAIGASGAASSVEGTGISTVTRVSTGLYDIVFEDPYHRYLCGQFQMQAASSATSGIHAIEAEGDPQLTVNASSSPKLRVHMLNSSNSLADPSDGSICRFVLYLRNSSTKDKGE